MTTIPAEAVTAAFDAISMGWDIPAPETMKRILEAAAPLIAAAAAHDALCWEQPPDGRLIACDRAASHAGNHTWTLTEATTSVAAAAAAAERDRILAYVTERIHELAAMGWPGQGETVPQSELRKVADLLEQP